MIGQALNTFNPLEKDCVRIKGSEIKKALGKVPINANIFFSIYQALLSGVDDEGYEEESGALQGSTEEAEES